MELDVTRVFLGLLFVVVGVVLFGGAIVIRLRMEQEVIGDKKVLRNSHFPFWSSDGLSDKGNTLRKIYNVIYFVLIAYAIALTVFMRAGD